MFDAEIGDKRRWAIPLGAESVVEWATALSAGTPAAFEKMQPGRARLLPGAAYDAAISAVGEDDADDVRALMEPAKWERSNRIIVPTMIAQHILGIGIIRGPVYVRPLPTCFELWGATYYERWISEKRMRAADHLPD